MSIAFGRLVHPPFRDRHIPDSATRAWDDLGQRKPVGVVFHTMVGTLWGTDSYFRSGAPALTDYGRVHKFTSHISRIGPEHQLPSGLISSSVDIHLSA